MHDTHKMRLLEFGSGLFPWVSVVSVYSKVLYTRTHKLKGYRSNYTQVGCSLALLWIVAKKEFIKPITFVVLIQ